MWLALQTVRREKEKDKKKSPQGQGLCRVLLSLLFSGHIECDAVHGNLIVRSSVHRVDCKNLTNSKNSIAWCPQLCTASAHNDTRNIVSYITSFQRQALYPHFCKALLRVRRFKMGVWRCCLFNSRPGTVQSGKTRSSSGKWRDSFVFLCFSLSSIEIEAYLRTSGTSQTNSFLGAALVTSCM